MKWLSLFSLLIQLALQIIKYLERQDALEAGRAEATKDLLERANEMALQAEAARDAIDMSDAAILRDPNNTDTQESDAGGVGASDPKDSV